VVARGRIFPSIGTSLVRIGNEVEIPDLLAGIELERADPVLRAPVCAGRSINDHVAEDQRRHRKVLALLRIGDLLAPE
jgi:hypothetical protein